MKRIHIFALCLLMLATRQAFADFIEFDWTARSTLGVADPQYNASFVFSGGTLQDGIFTPTGLITYSIGTPYGVSTPTSGPPLIFDTTTPFGPAFQLDGATILTVTNLPGGQRFDVATNNVALIFRRPEFPGASETEHIMSGTDMLQTFDGTWSETVIPAPEAANTLLLLALATSVIGVTRKSCPAQK